MLQSFKESEGLPRPMNRTLTILLTLLCVSITTSAQIALKVGVSGLDPSEPAW
jgi:hypothetical protein